VNLELSDDQEALRRAVREFFEKESPIPVVRAAEPTGFNDALWHQVSELGLSAIAVPEERGGGGAGWVELALVAELVGESLAPVPLVEAAVATALLASVAGEPVFEPVVAGRELATLALHPASNDTVPLVPAGAVADIVVALRDDELVAIRQQDKPAAVIPNLGAMPLADCSVTSDAIVLARGPEAIAAHGWAVDRWKLLTGAALVGIASRALDIGVEYVLQRRAFGVLIANFQTIQHRLADNATSLEGARLLAYQAAWAQDEELPEADSLARIAFLFASETAFKTASESLHFHGGYGYTLEYDIQLYFRRAKAWPLVAGDRRAAYAQLAHGLYTGKDG
jgi:alkylation response protein AidB-like acyl-CoA dehydrogenase